jgi:hypothetical protein
MTMMRLLLLLLLLYYEKLLPVRSPTTKWRWSLFWSFGSKSIS